MSSDFTTPPPAGPAPVEPELISRQPPRGPYSYAPPPPPRGPRIWPWLVLLVLVLGGGFLLLRLVGAGGSLASEIKVREKYHSGARFSRDKIAIIRVEGAITEGEGYVKDQIDAVKDDKHVKAVVLRVDSPGGTVTGSDYIYHHLRELLAEREIPLVVSMGSLCASGGYYVAMAVGQQEGTIYAEPTTWTGSIGVIIPHFNFGGLLKEWNIEEDAVASHRLKQMGTVTRAMTEEERAIFQALVDETFGRFKDIVRAGRPKLAADEALLDSVATGQIFTTPQALEKGLVDHEGFLEDAIDGAAELARIDPEQVKVVEYGRNLGLLDELLLGPNARVNQMASLEALLDLTAPRAYFLCTWLPGIDLAPRAR